MDKALRVKRIEEILVFAEACLLLAIKRRNVGWLWSYDYLMGCATDSIATAKALLIKLEEEVNG